MRPQPVSVLPSMPAFVRGVARIRGAPVPVVDLPALLEEHGSSSPARLVAIKADGRRVALAVDAVVGIRELDPRELSAWPPLLGPALRHATSAIGTLDSELLLVLQTGRLVPEEIWDLIGSGEHL